MWVDVRCIRNPTSSCLCICWTKAQRSASYTLVHKDQRPDLDKCTRSAIYGTPKIVGFPSVSHMDEDLPRIRSISRKRQPCTIADHWGRNCLCRLGGRPKQSRWSGRWRVCKRSWKLSDHFTLFPGAAPRRLVALTDRPLPYLPLQRRHYFGHHSGAQGEAVAQ